MPPDITEALATGWYVVQITLLVAGRHGNFGGVIEIEEPLGGRIWVMWPPQAVNQEKRLVVLLLQELDRAVGVDHVREVLVRPGPLAHPPELAGAAVEVLSRFPDDVFLPREGAKSTMKVLLGEIA